MACKGIMTQSKGKVLAVQPGLMVRPSMGIVFLAASGLTLIITYTSRLDCDYEVRKRLQSTRGAC